MNPRLLHDTVSPPQRFVPPQLLNRPHLPVVTWPPVWLYSAIWLVTAVGLVGAVDAWLESALFVVYLAVIIGVTASCGFAWELLMQPSPGC